MPCDELGADPLDPWTSFPIVYDAAVWREDYGKVRLQLDQTGQARLTYNLGGNVTTIYTDDEQLRNLEHLIVRGLKRLALDQRKGWAA